MFDFCLWCWIWKFYFSLPAYTCFGVETNVLKFCVFLSSVLVKDEEEKVECLCNKFCYVAAIICIHSCYSFPLWWIAFVSFFSLKDIYFLGDSMEVIFGCRAELLVSKLATCLAVLNLFVFVLLLYCFPYHIIIYNSVYNPVLNQLSTAIMG